MAKINVEYGVTVHLGPFSNNEFLRVYVAVHDIDCDQPLEAQLAGVGNTLPAVMEGLETLMSEKIAEAQGVKAVS